jgi:hypothetical protein
MSTPVEIPTAIERECPRCGSSADAFQEYCLECGFRLPLDPGAAGPARRLATGPWTWPVLLSGVVAILAAGVIVAVQLTTDEARPILTATSPQPTIATTPTAPEPVPAPTTVAEPPVQTQPPPPQPPPTNRVVSWPEGTRGWTVVLASLPQGGGRAGATAKAKEAAQAGLTEVGVLDSSQYSSLHPGYFVVFSGVYDARGQAEQGVSQARARGYQAAYAREIAP